MVMMTAPVCMRSSGSPGKLAAVCGLRPVLDQNLYLQQLTSNVFPETVSCKGGELDFSDQPRPGSDLRRPRPRRAAARHRGQRGNTERSAFGILTELAEAGYVVKEKNGRRNRYHIQAHLPLPEPVGRERTVGEVLAILTGTDP
jgi:hypothetical protein